MAIFVSILYLNELTGIEAPQVVEAPATASSQAEGAPSQEVGELLVQAEFALARNRPQDAIYFVTTLWSACHSANQPVPEISHRLFAQAVAALSPSSPERTSVRHPRRESFPEADTLGQSPDFERELPVAKESPDGGKQKAVFSLSEGNYPKSKSSPSTTRSQATSPEISQPSPPTRPRMQARLERGRASGFPQPPANRGRMDRSNAPPRRYPGGVSQRAPGPPRPPGFPPPPGSRQDGGYGPLQSREGGRPPGY